MSRTATVSRPHAPRIDIAPLDPADHSAYLALLDLTSDQGVPAEVAQVLALAPFRHPFTHGPALCLTARTRRATTPAGAVFAAVPEWAYEHPISQANAALASFLAATSIGIYGLAVAPEHRHLGMARALLAKTETLARSTRYRLASLIHKPELADFYQRLGYTSAHHIVIPTPDGAMALTQPRPMMTAVKPLHPSVRIQTVPGAPGPVVAGLVPGFDLPPTARFRDGRLFT
ncbi:GNAT family N-acetyltransferase (plasmid) [Streptomyces sp. NBC_01298]|uniref:GNAT family N-acetyltransferase n=1 Tax=Streptomyces sp. NBC_01298 TaxID=2903817 RepID=UPI002E133F67|nr:GNAT family N-acetyltransferase [Streptomyces sp. NBC_01298]